jgi:magnesium transporter
LQFPARTDFMNDALTEQDAPHDHDAPSLRPAFLAEVEAAIEAHDGARLRALAGDLHEADLGALIEALDHEFRPRLVALMGEDFDFAALTEVPDTIRENILEDLPTATVAEGVRELESDDAAAILGDLDESDREEILEALSPSDRIEIERSLDYDEHSAGRLMQTTLVAVPPSWTAGQTLDALRESDQEHLPDVFYEVFVVDERRHFLGTVFLDALVRARRTAAVASIMEADRRRVKVTDDREEVARLFERYNLVSAPVVDADDALVGMITIDDIVDVIQEVADEEIKALGGVSPREELDDPLISVARSRAVWLFVNLLTAFLASSVLALFQNELQKMVALAILAPIVASQGGNAATQTMTVTVRALATRELSRANTVRIVGREVAVGMLNGLLFGLITGVAAAAWFGVGALGAVIAAAMLTNLIAAAIGGIAVPLALTRLNIDPAVSSGAFVTTITDVVGYFSFLSFATIWFGLS